MISLFQPVQKKDYGILYAPQPHTTTSTLAFCRAMGTETYGTAKKTYWTVMQMSSTIQYREIGILTPILVYLNIFQT